MEASDIFVPTREMIDAVHEYTARRPQDRIRRALVPSLRERFGLDNRQAVEVLRRAVADRHGGADVRPS
jgi:hypothetical protein